MSADIKIRKTPKPNTIHDAFTSTPILNAALGKTWMASAERQQKSPTQINLLNAIVLSRARGPVEYGVLHIAQSRRLFEKNGAITGLSGKIASKGFLS